MVRSPQEKSGDVAGATRRRTSPRRQSNSGGGVVLSSVYLLKHTSKNDLVMRLKNVVEALADDSVEPNSPEHPGLGSLAALLVDDRYLTHRDKDVRLHTVLACMEIFAVYAPEPPWDEREILRVFAQMIRQLANLSHCTNAGQANFEHYQSILEQLAVVKIGVVLVELTRSLDSECSISQTERGGDGEISVEDAVEMLCDLIQTIIRCVSIDHPAEIYSYAVDAVAACVEEYYASIPVPVLEEILTPIGAGRIVYVTNPEFVEYTAAVAVAKKKGNKNNAVATTKIPPKEIQQTNQSYMVAKSVIKKVEDRVTGPIAGLLNGLLNGEANIVDQTNISTVDVRSSSKENKIAEATTTDVWSIIYELHRISNQVLTTVIGNVASSLKAPDVDMRLRVTKLLGRLFCSPLASIAVHFRPCFRQWMGRTNDIDAEIRKQTAKFLVTFMANKSSERELCEEASSALERLLLNDKSIDVRLICIRDVCDLAHNEPTSSGGSAISSRSSSRRASDDSRCPVVSAELLRAVGNKVGSKNKIERKDAVTGLAQIYYRHYAAEKLKPVQSGGDDCDISLIIGVLRDTCNIESDAYKRKRKSGSSKGQTSQGSLTYDIEEKYKWIPSVAFESAQYTDTSDPDMRNRVVQIVDDVLLGPTRSARCSRQVPLSVTSRAVGLAMILDSLRGGDGRFDTGAYKLMHYLVGQRAHLQRAVSAYIDARAEVRDCVQGSEEALTADAAAKEKLEYVATLTAPPAGGSSSDLKNVLESVHTARDRHIFRLLAAIAAPTHSASTRDRAFDELPKRTKSLGNATAAWVKSLGRRCAMGGFINEDIVLHCIMMAQECYHQEDIECTMIFLRAIKLAVSIFPSLGAPKDAFANLVELFGECQSLPQGKVISKAEKAVVSILSDILAFVSPTVSLPDRDDVDGDEDTFQSDLHALLIRQCTRNGTPGQAQNAVRTMAMLSKKSNDGNGEKGLFEPLLKALTSPSRMTRSQKGGDDVRIISVLAALSAVAEVAPYTFIARGGRGEKAINFALDNLLLGRAPDLDVSDGESDIDDESDQNEDKSPNKRSRSLPLQGRRKSSCATERGRSPQRIETVSVAAKRVCAAIDLLVTHIRAATLLQHKLTEVDDSRKIPSPDHIKAVFVTLEQILRDSGLPPSTRDRRSCKSCADRAALRHVAGVNLLRLCDPAIRLEATYLSVECWQTLANVFLDEEKVVREAIMIELSNMLTGTGKYTRYAPSLRLLALVIFCADAERGQGSFAANGSAANVGNKRTGATKMAAMQSISSLRLACEKILAECQAMGRDSEMNFERNLKMKIMPEYALPYALYLLSFRKESPIAGGTNADPVLNGEDETDGDTDVATEEARRKMLGKRLKCLFEPLVQSLGESADNISFLLRMTDVFGNSKWQPVDSRRCGAASDSISDSGHAETSFNTVSSIGISLEESTLYRPSAADSMIGEEAQAKLKIICLAARDVLLKFVKKDVNLTDFPGGIRIPDDLFCRVDELPDPSSISATKRNESVPQGSPILSRKSHVLLSPELDHSHDYDEESKTAESNPIHDGDIEHAKVAKDRNLVLSNSPRDSCEEKDNFGGMSPIAQSASPLNDSVSTNASSSRSFTLLSKRKSALAGTTPSSEAFITASKKSKKTTPAVQIRTGRSSTGSASSAESSSISSNTRRSRRNKSRVAKKVLKASELVEDELDFIAEASDDGTDASSVSRKRKAKKAGREDGRKIAAARVRKKKTGIANKMKGLSATSESDINSRNRRRTRA